MSLGAREEFTVTAYYKTSAMLSTLCAIKQTTQMKRQPSYIQLGVKTNRTSFIYGNRNGRNYIIAKAVSYYEIGTEDS